jgi:hypothetical protein
MVGSMMKRTNEDGTESMVENNYIYFVTCGNDAALQRWRFDVKEQELQCYTAEVPDSLKGVNFVCLDYTHYLPQPAGTYYVLIGCDDGSLVAFNSNEDVEDHFVDLGMRQRVIQGQVGVVSIKNGSVVMGTSSGIIAHYVINGSNVQPEDPQLMQFEQVDSAIIAVSMDDSNNEGLIGTEAGSIFYVNFNERIVIKLVSSNNNNQSAIEFCKLDPQNPAITVTNCG